MAVDCYSILGLDRSAPDELIDKAYRILARRFHPDSGPLANKDRFTRVQQAYETLNDPTKRATYDASMLEAERSGKATALDVYQLLPLRFEQAVSGGRISIARITPEGPRSLDIDIPAAVENGERLRITGYGQPGINGQQPGDLVLIVAVEPHRTFRRDGLDLYVEVPVPVDIAMLGGKIKAPTLNGAVDVDVPPGTSGGANLRVRAKGLHNPNGQHGDLFVVPRIKIPRAVADEARSLADGAGLQKIDARIVLLDHLGNRREFVLNGPATLVGRKSPSDLVIPDTSVSRRHCQFEIRDDALWVRDVGSRNGTFVNRERTEQIQLNAGDVVTVGHAHFFVVLNGEPDEVKPTPSSLKEGLDAVEYLPSGGHLPASGDPQQQADYSARLAELDEHERELKEIREEIDRDRERLNADRRALEEDREAVAASAPPPAAPPASTEADEALAAELADAKAEIESLRAELEQARQQVAESADKLAASSASDDAGAAALEAAESQLASVRSELAEVKQQLAEADANLTAERSTAAAATSQVESLRSELTSKGDDTAAAAAKLAADVAALATQRAAFDADRSSLEDARRELDETRSSIEADRAAVAADRESLAKARDTFQAQQAESTQRLDADRAELDKQREAFLATREKASAAVSDLDAQRVALEETSRQLEADHTAVREQREQLDADRAAIDARVAELDKRSAELESTEASLASDRASLNEARNALTAQQEHLAAERQQFDEQRGDLDAERAALAEQRANLDADREAAESARSEVDAGRSEIESSRAEVESAQAAIAAQREELESQKAELESAQAKLAAMQEQAETERASVETARGQIESQRRQLEERGNDLTQQTEALAATRRELEQQRAALESDRTAFEAEREAFAADRESLNKDRAEFESAQAAIDKDRAAIEEAESALEASAAELERRTAEMAQREQAVAERVESLEQLDQRLAERESAVAATQQQLEHRSAELDQQATELAELERRAAELAELETALNGRAAEVDRRAAELAERSDSLDEQEQQLSAKRRQLTETEREAEGRIHELELRAAQLVQHLQGLGRGAAPAPPPVVPVASPVSAPPPVVSEEPSDTDEDDAGMTDADIATTDADIDAEAPLPHVPGSAAHFRIEPARSGEPISVAPNHLRSASGYRDRKGHWHLFADYIEADRGAAHTWNAEVRYYRSETGSQWQWAQTPFPRGEWTGDPKTSAPDCYSTASPAVALAGDRLLVFYAGRGGVDPDGKPKILAGTGDEGYLRSVIMLASCRVDDDGSPAEPFVLHGPVIEPGNGWDALRVDQPTATVVDGVVHLFYTGYDDARDLGRRKLGYATADLADLAFTKHAEPVLAAPGGGETPRVFRYDDRFHLFYQHFDHVDAARWRHYSAASLPDFSLVDSGLFAGPHGKPGELMVWLDPSGRLLTPHRALVTAQEAGVSQLVRYDLQVVGEPVAASK